MRGVRLATHGVLFEALTMLTQVGGLVWLAARLFRRPILAFVVIYAGVWGAVQVAAPLVGRVPLPCQTGGPCAGANAVAGGLFRV